MGKNTFGKTMPKALSQNLKIMGEQIMLARKRRDLSMQDIADRATVIDSDGKAFGQSDACF